MPYSFQKTLPPVIEGGKPQKCNALLLSDREWYKLQYDLRWKEHEAAAVRMNLARRRAIKSKSDELKKNWRDTVANIRRKQLDARDARFASYLAEREERFNQIQREKAEEKRLYLEECDKLVYYTKDSVKSLNAAMVFAEVLRERELQIEFDKKLREIEVAREAVYAAKVKKDVEDYHEEERKKKEEKEARMREYRIETLKDVKEREENANAEMKKNKELEKEDMVNLRKEVEKGEKIERAAIEALRADVRKNVDDALQFDRMGKAAKKIEDDEEDRVIAVYAEAKQRIAKMCKLREKECQDEVVRKREKMKEKLAAEAKVKQDNEDELLRRAVEKRDAEEERVRLEKEAYHKRMVKERQDNHREHLEAEAKRLEEEKQMKKWEMLQRFRTEEENEAHAKKLQERREEQIVETREDLARQVAEREALLEGIREPDLYALEKAYWKAEDDAYFKYADEILEESRKVGRPLMPIERAIYLYKKENGLLPRKTPSPAHKSTIPFGRAKDKSHMGGKKPRRRKKTSTAPDNQCNCGPILCTCNWPPVTCLCPS